MPQARSVGMMRQMGRSIFATVWPAVLLCPLLLSCQSADSRASREHFSASLDGTNLSITMHGRSGSADLGSQLNAVRVNQSEVVFSAHTAAGVFLVIEFIGPSPPQPGRDDCNNNGLEENLVWVAFDPSLHPINASSALIGSCTQRIDPGPGILQDARSLSVRYDCNSEHVRRILFFRKAAPQLGFTVQTEQLDSGQ
jgi:hypothetical protein